MADFSAITAENWAQREIEKAHVAAKREKKIAHKRRNRRAG
ncbi:hypothetical protein [Maritimibacter harenae]|nr:hypothetical protein [Maritimibacter harenae]